MMFWVGSTVTLTACCLAISQISNAVAAPNGGRGMKEIAQEKDFLFFMGSLSYPPPTRPPTKTPSNPPTPICHDQSDFVTRIKGIAVRCDSIQYEADRIKYCNQIRMNRKTRERQQIKYSCPEACKFDCSETKPPTKSPSYSPTNIPSRPPSDSPSGGPTKSPSGSPTESPTKKPSDSPSESPS
eukprot:CAMPEP_0113302960 /NCGR_PEP_ID=MMETSP0010_2-20120614/3574_1 /TAXON_ID=216773 ORGANISM="Corethron hystrix, Strain 308" /NCGR_SAMPLE_ID=MMETSP0010_2 /ASSEMBLY_ACC=CAM_ASM_000155 /LENGTH=183 /DNA_ID=CAMNT_0000156875 /DNA_START=102 /DNA_END=650 /DNA_ORIENTATION=- /assembly_acc=CAM_ASM_000155